MTLLNRMKTLYYPPLRMDNWMEEYIVSHSKIQLWGFYFRVQPFVLIAIICAVLLSFVLFLPASPFPQPWSSLAAIIVLIALTAAINHPITKDSLRNETFRYFDLDKSIVYDALLVFADKYGYQVDKMPHKNYEPFYLREKDGTEIIEMEKAADAIRFERPHAEKHTNTMWRRMDNVGSAQDFLPYITDRMTELDKEGIPLSSRSRLLIFTSTLPLELIIYTAENNISPESALVLVENNIPVAEWAQYSGAPAEWVESLVQP